MKKPGQTKRASFPPREKLAICEAVERMIAGGMTMVVAVRKLTKDEVKTDERTD